MEDRKQNMTWLDFLFDKTGTLVYSHLSSSNPDPTASQLIQQFLDKSGCLALPVSSLWNGQESSNIEVTGTLRYKRLLLLSFHVSAYLHWNLNTLEKCLPLLSQFVLLKELVKLYYKQSQGTVLKLDLTKCEKSSIIALLLYHRWVVRAVVQQSSVRMSKSKGNESAQDLKGIKSEENKLTEMLHEEESISVDILEQAVEWNEDLPFPLLKSLKYEDTKSEEVKMKTLNDEVKVISYQEIIGQVAYDLGTLYFFKENIGKAKYLFEKCAAVQHLKSSFYNVDKATLSGYYTACCSLLHCPVCPNLVSHQSVMSQIEQSKYNGYQELVDLLIKDNIAQEIPSSYRKYLEFDAARLSRADSRIETDLVWHVTCCNIVGNILAGRCAQSDAWKQLEHSSNNQFEVFIKMCKDTLSEMRINENKNIANQYISSLQYLVRSLLTEKYEKERLEILVKMEAFQILDVDEYKRLVEKRAEKSRSDVISFSIIPCQAHQVTRNEMQIQINQLEHELKTTWNAHQVTDILMQLHGLDPDPHKKHAKGYENTVYTSFIQDLKDDVLQDILLVLFDKANQCSQRKDFILASGFLDFGLQTIQEQRKRYGNSPIFDKICNFLNQEILVASVMLAEENRDRVSNDVLKKMRCHLYTMSDFSPRPHVSDIMVIYLLNTKEWRILAEADVRVATSPVDYRELCRCLAGTCINVSNTINYKKMSKNLWDAIIRIFTSTVQHKRMLPDGTIIDVKRDAGNLPYFVKFFSKITDDTCLSLIISCLERIRSLEPTNEELDKEQNDFPMYNHLWPSSTPSPSKVDFTQIGLALLEAIDYSVTVHPFNPTFLRIQGDTFYDNKNHLNALRCYLQSGASSSDFFSFEVPKTIWNNEIYRKIISCCTVFNAHTQVAVLCQYLEPVDYTLAFNAMKELSRNDASEFYYKYIWDVTLLEFVINIHARRGEQDKKQIATQALGQPELNSCNHGAILQNARRVRSSSFLQVLAKQYL